MSPSHLTDEYPMTSKAFSSLHLKIHMLKNLAFKVRKIREGS